MCDAKVSAAVMLKINEEVAFTSACISHPMIDTDSTVRHFDVSREVKTMWGHGEMVDGDGVRYLRTLIPVYPDGPGTKPDNAWLYYPDNGFDPSTFQSNSKILVRNVPGDADGSVQINQTADGSTVSKQCDVQSKDNTLNVPRHIIKSAGWHAGDGIRVDINGTVVSLHKDNDGKQKVDKEGRIRLHKTSLDALNAKSLTALLVNGTSGDHIQISNLRWPAHQPVAPAVVDDEDAAAVASNSDSVWASQS